MFTSLVKVNSGLSSGSIPRVPQLLGVGSESCYGSISLALMALVPPPTVTAGLAAEDAARGVVQDVVCRGGGDRVLSTRPCWCRVVHTYRVEMDLGLRLKADVITFSFCKVLLSTIYQAVLALINVPLVPVVCGVTDSSLVPDPRGM
jgi:hypothetical protein